MFERIVIPLDGSAFAEAALRPACELAERFGSRLLLMRAVEPFGLPPISPRSATGATGAEKSNKSNESNESEEHVEQYDEADAYLHDQVDQLRMAGYAADFALYIAAPGASIAGTAELNHADLIVMATRLAWTLTSLPPTSRQHASVTLDVLARSRVPILSCHLLPSSLSPTVSAHLETGEATATGSKVAIPWLAGPDLPIVVPLDGSAFAEQALATAEALAKAFGAYLVLAQALPPHVNGQSKSQHEARDYLTHVRAGLEARGVTAITAAEVGVPINVIEHLWREHGAGLVVMASHGYSGHRKQTDSDAGYLPPRDPLVGSVAAAILEELEVPTLVIQPTVCVD